MPKFSVSLSMLFKEHPFLDRFAVCREAGFKYVEYMFPYEYKPEILKDHLNKNGLTQVMFNLPAGNWEAGERGIAANPSRIEEFRQGVDLALKYANVLNVDRINCLVGRPGEGVSDKESWQVLLKNLDYAATEFAKTNRILLVEPVNSYDIPGFFINTTQQGLKLLQEVGAENMKLQCDVYHQQRMEGELTMTISNHLKKIGHIQIADNPGRHQPGTGEINYHFLLTELDRMGYDGFVGLEYIPTPDTASSLGWIEEFGFVL